MQKQDVKRVALERINKLYDLAVKEFRSNPLLSKRYIALIRRLRDKGQVRLPRIISRHVCRHCSSLLVEGVNLKVRIDSRNHQVVYSCLSCNNVMRFPFVKELKGSHQSKN